MSEANRIPAKLEQALKRFKLGDSAENDQRERELAALKFDAGDQWPDWVKRSRAGASPGTADNIGARPMLTISQIDQPIQQIINQQRSADLGVNIRPTGSTSVDDAEVRQGLIRHIQVQSRASMARDWAYERAVKAGRGYYEIRKVWSEDQQFPFDQELRIDRILDQGKVLLDPFAQQPDWSDGDWAFKWSDYPVDRFKREFPKAALSVVDESELTAAAEQNPGWIGGDDENRTIRVAEYWYAEYTPTRVGLYSLPDGAEVAVWDGETVPEGAQPVIEGAEPVARVVQKRSLRWCKITARDILEETAWEGTRIPIIPVIAKEYNLNGERMWKGAVEPAMDAQRLVNFTASGIAEGVGIAPKAPFMLDPEQIAGFESDWNNANTRTKPFLARRAFNDRGDPYPAIERLTAEPPIQAMTLLLGQATQFVQQTTATPASSLGQLDPTHRSGKAIQALQQQSELANSNYLDSFASISVTLEGIILNEMLGHVYGRPGRIVQVLGEDRKPEPVMLNAPFVDGPKGPLPAPPVANPASPPKTIDLKKGQYHVVVEVGKTERTKRESASAAMGELVPHLPPEMAAAVLPTYIKSLDFDGSQQVAAIIEKMLPPHLQEQKDGQPAPMPPEVQQQIQQMQQQMQELQQLADKNQTDLMKAQIQAQADVEKSRVDGEVRVRVAQIQAQSAVTKAEIDAQMGEMGHQIARLEQMIGNDHDLRVQAIDHEHEAQMAAVEHAQALDRAEQGAAFASDQMTQQAAMQPAQGEA